MSDEMQEQLDMITVELGQVMDERDAALAVIEQAKNVHGGDTWKDDLNYVRRILSQSPTSALARVKAEALYDAARELPAQARHDELALHDARYLLELPVNSRIMLNGASRMGERMVKRAREIEEAAKDA